MSRYRDRLQIIADILLVVDRRARKTRIMYQANLSYRLLSRYLHEVLNAGLIKLEDDECYVLTAKGKVFLSRHGEYSKRCRSLEEHLSHVSIEKKALESLCGNPGAANRYLNCRSTNKEKGK